MKKIEYFGKQYDVPVDATYVATDPNGDIYWFIEKPFIGELFIEWLPSRGLTGQIKGANRSSYDWEYSLVKFPPVVKFEIIHGTKTTKFVKYFGNQYEVPNTATHMATDEDGTIHWYVLNDASDIKCDHEEWIFNKYAPSYTTCDKVDEIEYCGDWKQSLIKI